MSPEQAQAVKVWIMGAYDAFDTAEKLLASKKYHHALFFCHLALEKALKAKFIELQDTFPPYIHELPLLAGKINHALTADQLTALDTINTFNIAARYQEHKQELYRRATPKYTAQWISITDDLLKTLLG